MIQQCIKVLLLLPVVVSGLAVARDESNNLGQTIAASINRAFKTLKALEHEGQGEDARFLPSMMEALLSKQEVLGSSEVAKVVSQANSLAEHQPLPVEDPVCSRDWSRPCPDGWEIIGESACSASKSYTGGCGRIQKLGEAPVQTKVEFASRCKAPWPCHGGEDCPSGRDYEHCPIGWDAVGSGFCKRGSSDSSKCASLFNIEDMDIADKQWLANDCKVKWACKASCEQNFGAVCPEDWNNIANLCVAPATYAGDCGYSLNTTGMSAAQKQSFAAKCVVRFPCAQVGSSFAAPERESLRRNGPVSDEREVGHDELKQMNPALPKETFTVPSGPLDILGGIHF